MKFFQGFILLGLSASLCHAQFGRGGGDWMTTGADPHRTSAVRSDAKISPAKLAKPGFDFIWKVQADPNTKQALAAPVLLNGYIGYRGFRSLAFVGGTGDKVVGIDSDLGRVEWRQQLPAPASGACATAEVAMTRPTNAAFPAQDTQFAAFGPRFGPAKSTVGEPAEGATTITTVASAGANFAPGPPRAPAGRGPALPGGFGRTPSVLDVIARDGMLHSIYVSNGQPWQPPVRMAPPNTTLRGLMVVDNVAYAAAGQGCDGPLNEVLALDLESKQVASFHLKEGAIAGAAGFAMAPDGTVYVSTTAGELLALEAKKLTLKSAYKAGQPFATSPVIFPNGEAAWIAAATSDGRIHLLNAASLGTALATSEAAGSPVSSLATWQDADGTRWLIGSTAGSVSAWKVALSGTPALQTGWKSRDVAAPLAPIVVNGVVFTAATGASPVLYALDGATGKELWNSGRKIASAIRGGGLSAGNSQIYLGSNDGALYAFGFPIEH